MLTASPLSHGMRPQGRPPMELLPQNKVCNWLHIWKISHKNAGWGIARVGSMLTQGQGIKGGLQDALVQNPGSPPQQDRCLTLHFCQIWTTFGPSGHCSLLPFPLLSSIFLSFSLFHSSLLLSWTLSPCTHFRLGLIVFHGFKSLLVMPLPGRTLFEPLCKVQIPLIKASCSPGACRSLELPLAGGEAPTFLAMLSGLTPSRISSSLTLITQGLFLPMTV